MRKILLVEDEESLRQIFEVWIERLGGYELDTAANGREGLELLNQNDYDVVFSDLRMPGGITGIDVLKHVRSLTTLTQVVILTAHGSVENAIEAMKLGAYDYVQKPFQLNELEAILEKCIEKHLLLSENVRLRNTLQSQFDFDSLIGRSPAMNVVFDRLKSVAKSNATVLVLGENGTGKELVTRALHFNSDRRKGNFVAINCGAIAESLWETEFFGHVKGAYTGAERAKPGFFEQADGGTLFLDEIGEMPLHMQVKLLRVLQERKVRPLGAEKDREVDVRIIAATNKRLEEEVKAERFREDLFYRLNVFPIEMPPLRERKEDIPLLAQHFLEHFRKEHHRNVQMIKQETMELLLDYPYPGNIRELKNIMEQSVLLEGSEVLSPASLPSIVAKRQTRHKALQNASLCLPEEGLEAYLDEVERKLLALALEEANDVKKEAARLLKVSYRSFRHRLKKFDEWSGNTEH
ncbi:MAG: Fis family transcriptional regulator [Deltaproteobacteria bacterium]|nr:Fis family transcriptional regulator [Deltaproteobacteria bacterium]MBU54501.1 Fis family transcriptional regulator [Deltaproteobacteria bacterium]